MCFCMGGVELVRKFFPYDSWRRFQRRVAEVVFEGVLGRRVVVVCAPTGSGKTAAVLAGVLGAVEACGVGLRVFYVVRTRTGFQAPLRELALLRSRGVSVPFALFRNKKVMCGVDVGDLPYRDFIEECARLRREGLCSFYRRFKEVGVEPILEEISGASTFLDYVDVAVSYGLCPYEVSKALARDAWIVIATYPYLVDPGVRWYLFSSLPYGLDKVIAVFDEAHNLHSALIDALSSEITLRTLESGLRECAKLGDVCREVASCLEKLVKRLKALCASARPKSLKYVGDPEVPKLLEEIYDYAPDIPPKQLLRTRHLRYVVSFANSFAEAPRDRYSLFILREGSSCKLVNKCLDVSYYMEELVKSLHSIVLVSATMPSREALCKILGIDESLITEVRFGLVDFIPKENIRLHVATDVTTRYTERSEEMFERIAKWIDTVYETEEGSVLAVVPSYAVLSRVAPKVKAPKIVESEYTEIEHVVEEVRKRRVVVMGVAGGKLVEGVEFREGGKSLISAIIVAGVPFPEPDDFVTQLIAKLSRRVGVEFARRYVMLESAIIKVKQTIGRAIRSENDRVKVYLLDRRFLARTIKDMLSDTLDFSTARIMRLENVVRK